MTSGVFNYAYSQDNGNGSWTLYFQNSHSGTASNWQGSGTTYYFSHNEVSTNGGAWAGPYAYTDSRTEYPGYNAGFDWQVRAAYHYGSPNGPIVYPESASGSGSTGPPPPPPPPPAPATPGMYSSGTDDGYLHFSWDNVSASGYNYSGVANGSTTGTYLDVYVGAGNSGTLTIQAYNTGPGGTSYSGTNSISAYSPYPPTPTPSTPNCYASVSGTVANFSWDYVGANDYNVYINGSYYTTITGTGLSLNEGYNTSTSCFVQAYNTGPGGTSYSGYSNTATATIGPPPPPPAPAAPTLSGWSSATTNNLSWNSVSGATSYSIYKDGGVLTEGVTATSWANGGNAPGSNHSYQVYAVATNSNGSSYSPASNAVPLHTNTPPSDPGPPSPSANPVDGVASINWSASTDAEGDALHYYLDVSRDSGSNWTRILNNVQPGVSYDFSSLGSGTAMLRVLAADIYEAYNPGGWINGPSFSILHTKAGASTLIMSSSLSVPAVDTISSFALCAGDSSLLSTGFDTRLGLVSMNDTSFLTSTGQETATGVATLSSTSVVHAAASVLQLALVMSSSLSADGLRAPQGAAALVCDSSVLPTPNLTGYALAALASDSSLLSLSSLTTSGASNMVSDTSVTITPSQAGTAALVADSVLLETASVYSSADFRYFNVHSGTWEIIPAQRWDGTGWVICPVMFFDAANGVWRRAR